VHLRREVLEQERHAGTDVGVVDEVVVVEDERDRRRHLVELVQELRVRPTSTPGADRALVSISVLPWLEA
jgi:hypothetical protein